MRSERVAVLMGGPSSEHDVSLASGAQILRVLDGRWPTLRVEIQRDGAWRIGQGERARSLSTVGAALDALKDGADVVFIGLHGVFGEDGTVQALLETLGLPYVGSGIGASALAMDKARAKAIYRAHGLPTPRSLHLAPGEPGADADIAAMHPCVVKPSASGSSFGVSFPADGAAAVAAVRDHLSRGLEVVVEEVIRGRELTCGVLDHPDGPRPLPVTAIVPSAEHAFFDYVAKYTPGATDEITPAPIPDALRDEVQRLAVAAHRALGCRDLSRTDVMVSQDGSPLLLETNTLPGFTETSLLPQAAIAAGMSFGGLVDHLLERALGRATAGPAGSQAG